MTTARILIITIGLSIPIDMEQTGTIVRWFLQLFSVA